jgi:tetratricopeptide (TPR) repeat protein
MAKKKKSSRQKSKKKQGLNTRLVLILALVFVGVVASGGGAYWYFTKGRISTNINAGDAAAAQGDHRKAVKYYGRVLYRNPEHEVALANLIDAYEQIVPITSEESLQYYDARFSALLARANTRRTNAAHFRFLIDEVYYAARVTNLERFWITLQSLCDRVVERFEQTDPLYSEALLYKGMCELRLRDGEMTDDIREDGHIAFPGEEELQAHLLLNPDSDEGRANLAFGRLAVARRLELEGRIGQASKNLLIAEASYEEALRRNPDGIATAIMVLRDLIIRRIVQINKVQNDSSSVNSTEIEELTAKIGVALDHAESIVMSNPGVLPIKVQELLMFFKRADFEHGLDRAIVMLEKYLAAHPEDLRMRLALSDAMFESGDSEGARRVANEVLLAPQQPISLTSLQQFGLRRSASSLLFEIEYRKLNTGEVEEKKANLATVLEARQELAVHLGSDEEHPIALRADARIAMAQKEYRKAAGLFERLIFLGNRVPGSVYRNAAVCLIEIGQSGLALERISTALAVEPMQLDHYLAKAMMQGRLRMPAEGLRTLESLPRGIQSDHEGVVAARQTLILLSKSQNKESIQSVSDPVLRAIGEAERANRVGRSEAAITLLHNAINAAPKPDVRLLGALAQVYNFTGDQEKAVEYMDLAIELHPDNERLRGIRLMYATGDTIALIRSEVERMHPDDPTAQKESYFVSLNQMLAVQRSKVGQYESMGHVENAAMATKKVAAVEAEMNTVRSSVMGNGLSMNSGIFGIQLDEAISLRKWDDAERLIEFGIENNIDEAGGLLILARYKLSRSMHAGSEGDSAEAIEFATEAAIAARQATEVIAWSDTAWVTLGMAFEVVQNNEEAMRAYEQAFRRNPNNPRTAQLYSSMLIRNGEASSTRAISVLRTANELMPSDNIIREAWLAAEVQQGDLKTVLQERYARLRMDPDDRLNMLQLGKLLAGLVPNRALLINDYGEELYPDRRWALMSPQQRQSILDEQLGVWESAVNDILESSSTSPDPSLEQAMIHAEVYRDLDRRSDATRIAQEYISSIEDDPDYISSVLSFSNFLLLSDRGREAEAMMKAAIPKQDMETKPINIALGYLYSQIGDDRRALDHLQLGFQASGRPELRQMIVMALIRLRRFEQAQAEIDATVGTGQPSYESLILMADLEKERSAMAGSQGDGALQRKSRAMHRELLERANQVDIDRLQPYIDLVDSLLVEYGATHEPQLLNQARFILDKGVERLPDSSALIVKRVDILEAQGDLAEAILDLELMLRKFVDSSTLRDRLVIAYLKSGQQSKAEAILNDVIALHPDDARWHEAIGDFYQSLPEAALVRATASYLKAYQINPTRAIIFKLRRVTRGNERWDFNAMIDLIQRSGTAIESDPQLVGLYARALAGKGAYDRADAQLKRSYPMYVAGISAGKMPDSALRQWYEDLYAVYSSRKPELGAALARAMAGADPAYWDSIGLGTYWALYGHIGYSNAIVQQQKVVDRTSVEAPELRAQMLNMLGSYQIAHGDAEMSSRTFKTIIDEYPENSSALNNYAFILAESLGRADEALPYAKQALALDSESTDLLDTISTIYALLGQHENAMVSRLRHHALQPSNAEVVLEISRSYMTDYGDASRALEFAELASKIMPKDPEIMGTLGWSYYRTGESGKGEELLRSSIKLQPTARTHLHMAQVLIDRSRMDMARTHLQAGLDLSPDVVTLEEIKRLQDDIGSG